MAQKMEKLDVAIAVCRPLLWPRVRRLIRDVELDMATAHGAAANGLVCGNPGQKLTDEEYDEMSVIGVARFTDLFEELEEDFKVGDSDGNGNSTAEELTQGTMLMGEETADEEVDVAICWSGLPRRLCEGAERAAADNGVGR